MAPDIRRRIIKFVLLFLPLSAWLLTAKIMSGIPFSQVTWLVLSHWVISTPDYTALVAAPIIGFVIALALALTLKRHATKAGFDGAGYKIHIRGTEAVPIKTLRKLCSERGKQQINVAGVPMPTLIENLHLLIGGATGSGKTVLLRGTLLSTLMRGDRGIIVDPNGTFYSTFGQPGDVILNPYDERTEGWSFFNEVRADYDWKRLAFSIVPLGTDANAEEWNLSLIHI